MLWIPFYHKGDLWHLELLFWAITKKVTVLFFLDSWSIFRFQIRLGGTIGWCPWSVILVANWGTFWLERFCIWLERFKLGFYPQCRIRLKNEFYSPNCNYVFLGFWPKLQCCDFCHKFRFLGKITMNGQNNCWTNVSLIYHKISDFWPKFRCLPFVEKHSFVPNSIAVRIVELYDFESDFESGRV